ncbi:hypothetical protein [Sinorhizobium fredii]|uniref:Transmembrane protein n=2 Tax=Rhizobium fredii TaxID=380 RepID=A0A844A716_RHIFR|nr:hypothetical protein [Sinorhizobium fredii]AWI58546.1 hypothetical protein AB395_00002902 [Sinorhizobium fredii CCBAU 45436]AWM26258.1 putative transmembrane protein [Sinorhizobium fredii CCBAU 25509]KSV87440.1 hypothetical protein N181_18870 [Sinorhizobium fredii USDA 205]MQW96684.1 hypothetical protein [Sinorhizobium fredii]MQX07416.1 hypothetical protein [Sinorhizobium fredii]
MQAFRTKKAAIDLIPPERVPRSDAPVARNFDYVDVEFETVAPSPRRGPYPVFNDNRRPAARSVPRPTTTVRSGAAARLLAIAETRLRAMPARRFSGLAAGLGLAAFLLMAGLGGHGDADAHPLAIEGVTTSLDYAGGMRVLSVYGAIDNRSDLEQRLPPVVVEVMHNGRAVTATRLMPEGAAIAPGESRRFVTRLPYAGGKMPAVTVSFAENSVSPR